MALFAWLFDRGDQGIDKDEVLDVVWPDRDLQQADIGFHRTMLGLRRALAAHGQPHAIEFRLDRYRLSEGVIAWSDSRAFSALRTRGLCETDAARAVRALEDARALYRAEYLDDCPYFGDSAAVQQRRDELSAELLDVLVVLAQRYEELGNAAMAASVRRQAAAAGWGDARHVAELGAPA